MYSKKEPEWVVVVFVAVCLCLGWTVKSVSTERARFTGDKVSFDYPMGWLRANDFSAMGSSGAGGAIDTGSQVLWQKPAYQRLFKATGAVAGSTYATTCEVQMRRLARSESPKFEDVAAGVTLDYKNSKAMFRLLGTGPVNIAGLAGIKMDYGFVADPAADAGATSMPVVARGEDFLLVADNLLYHLSFTFDENAADKDAAAAVVDMVTRSFSIAKEAKR